MILMKKSKMFCTLEQTFSDLKVSNAIDNCLSLQIHGSSKHSMVLLHLFSMFQVYDALSSTQ